MNEILIRTNRSFYNVGDTVYGLVYLNIEHPTNGRGVKISISGHSKVKYSSKSKDIPSTDFLPELQAEKNYIKCQDVVLYSSEVSFMIDVFRIPFKFVLPSNIPGSITAFGENKEAIWHAFVDYNIEAKVIDCNELYTNATFKVRTSPPVDYPIEVNTECSHSFLLFWNKKYSVTARFEEASYEAGDNKHAKLFVHYKTLSNVNVQEITVKLLMFFALSPGPLNRKPSINKAVPDHYRPSYIFPYDNAETVIWETCLTNTDGELSKTTFEIMVPLKDLSPTISSEIIRCSYKMNISITLENKKSICLDVPGPYVLSADDDMWCERSHPDWMNKGKTTSPNVSLGENFRVSRRILYEEYFGLPGFSPL